MKWSGRFEGYHANDFRRDLVSGLIVGIIAIPLGMGFAIASGVSPQYGIYTTVIAGFFISLLGGSKFQIGGPTGAFIPVLFAITMQYGYENLLVSGLLAGMLLVLMGVFKLGALIRFIPRPVTVGFTAGIAVIIFTGQIASFLGLKDIQKHEYFFSNMKEIGMHLATINPYSVAAAVMSLAMIVITPKLFPKIPGSLVGLVLSSIAAAWFMDGKVATIGSTYGAIPSSLPGFHWPDITFERIQQLIAPAFVIAMLGGIESLLSAVVADRMSGTRHSSNRELIGQGIANMITPLFGGIPATGAIARTATNIRNGAASPISGMIHSITVLLVLLAFAPWASRIPLASMAPVLMVVAWNMSERKEFIHVLKTKTGDSIVLMITFVLTVLTDLTTAVGAGLLASVIWFIKRMSESLSVAKVLPDPDARHGKVVPYMVREGHDCPQISIFTVEGALFFGAAALFEQTVMRAIHYRPNIVLLRMGKVPLMDTTGESNLSNVVEHFHGQERTVLISGIQPQPKEVMQRTGLEKRVGKEHFFEHTGEAIHYALTRLETRKCAGCRHFAFRECALLSAQPHETKIPDGS
ncbi:SulP family inorganic anion transporter [Paenibacillus allorhizosphaerae]|uniref:C4-dicarboxylic acid transporter DauA n=1 Tax=Paenibacillus allorhizosphaerae TaxID=2849866 RepID=A0ABM8VID3_9BACL|nr:SulP family inorganic anion transporter [Paenibacillus allorhizosphaerae]CAG7644012.1 C4-dicarboxylic acid transporter DauA [Paenibacillus allorhizosphaerae]